MVGTASTLVTVVVPVGLGDAMSPRLRAQLAMLPSWAQVREVHAGVATASDVLATQTHEVATGQSPQWQALGASCGRAAQQNAGARNAAGDWLWFLHADCVLAADTLPALVRFIDARVDRDDHVLGADTGSRLKPLLQRRVAAQRNRPAGFGYFDLRFLDDGPALMRLNAAGAWIRSHCFGLPFGDQGLLIRRDAFERVGGFDPRLDCGEDHDLVWRLRRAGVRPRPVGAVLFTSARRYAERGWWTTTAWHLCETWRQARRFSRVEAPR